MGREAKIQEKLIKHLKKRGCYVIKTKPGPGVPVGCPDVFAFLEGWWGAFEVKSARNAKFQPLQKETIEKLNGWSTTWVVYPENFEEIKDELDRLLI